jgi:integrase/recombinase XerD
VTASAFSPQSLDVVLAARILEAAMRDRSYQQQTRLGRDVATYLAWKELGVAPRTLAIYELYLASLCLHVAAVDPSTAEIAEREDLLLRCLTSFPAGSRRLAKNAWSGFFKWASHPKRGLCRYNPIADLPAIRPGATPIYDIFSLAEQQQLLLAADRLPLSWIQRLRARALIDLGIRSDEARGLQPHHHVDLTDRVVWVRGKGSKERLVPFGDEFFKAVIAYRNRPIPNVMRFDRQVADRPPLVDDYLFFPVGFAHSRLVWTKPWKQLSDRAIRYWWDRLIAESGVRYRSLHMNRHTVGTNLSDAGAGLETVQDWLGHADPKTTKVYIHNSRERLQRGRGLLDGYRQGQAG